MSNKCPSQKVSPLPPPISLFYILVGMQGKLVPNATLLKLFKLILQLNQYRRKVSFLFKFFLSPYGCFSFIYVISTLIFVLFVHQLYKCSLNQITLFAISTPHFSKTLNKCPPPIQGNTLAVEVNCLQLF